MEKDIETLLRTSKTIAIVGLSDKPDLEVLETSTSLGCRERRNVLEHARDLSITTTIRRSHDRDSYPI